MERGRRDLTSVDLKVVSTDKQDVLGSIGTTQDERLFRYCQIGSSSVSAGYLLAPPAISTNFAGLSVASAVTASVNATQVEVKLGSSASATKDQFVDGTLVVQAGTGSGYSYRIYGNQLGTASSNMTVYLSEPLLASIDTTTKVTIIPNLWAGLTTQLLAGGSSGDNPKVVGAAVNAMPANTYGWIQTEGACTLINDGSNNAGQGAGKIFQGLNLVLSPSVAGEVCVASATLDADKQNIGFSLQPQSTISTSAGTPFGAYLTIF